MLKIHANPFSCYVPCCSCVEFNTFIAVFRAGEQGRFWYAVLGGSLEVRYHAPDTENKVWQKTYSNIVRCEIVIFLKKKNEN